jgi:hypothetical protein
LSEAVRSRTRHDVARLAVLRKMGLAEPAGPNTWSVRRDFEQVLRAMQRTADRQRTLAAHGALMSDERLPIEMLDLMQAASVEGRVLVHGQDEQTGRNYLMLEGTDAKIHYIRYTAEMEEARSRGELRVNSFVRLQRLTGVGDLDVNDLGDAEKLLKNTHYIRETTRELMKHHIPTQDGWGGWLGRYQKAIAEMALETSQHKRDQLPVRERRRSRSSDRGR